MHTYEQELGRIDDRRRGRGPGGAERRKADLARRRAPRMRTLKGAAITVPAGGTAVRCVVRNISETGACLELHSPVFLSHSFDLAFDDPDWTPRACRVVWRESRLLGVEFRTTETEGGPIRRAIQRLLAK
jgi:PilZ domain